MMKEHVGVSAMSTSSQVPAGLQQASGKALQVFDDVEAERLRPYHSELDRWHTELAQLIILEARELTEGGKAKYSVKYMGKGAIESVDWAKVLLDELISGTILRREVVHIAAVCVENALGNSGGFVRHLHCRVE